MRLGAIDQGTTSSRALMLSDGKAEISAKLMHKQFFPASGWVEHDPRELLKNILVCCDSLESADALGFGNQGESCLAWDKKTGEPISPVIVWQDNRTSIITNKLKNDGHEEKVKALSGLPLDPYFSASKLAWIIENVPEAKGILYKNRLALGTTDAFFLHNLVGRFVTDVTTASRTSLMNLKTMQWDDELCDLFNVPKDTLPEILSTQDEFGELKVKGRNIPLRASVVDQQASLYGHGCRNVGDTKITLGTGAFAQVINGNFPEMNDSHGLLPTVAWRLGNDTPIYALDGGVYNAASAVNWARGLGLFSDYKEINAFDTPAAIDRGLIFVPALSGLACPHWQRDSRACFEGMSLDTGPLDLVQAVLEGVALRIAEVIFAMDKRVPIGEEISIDGGLSKNPYICQFLSEVLGRSIRVMDHSELTAIGCAQLAGSGLKEVSVTDKKGRLFVPKEKLRPEWMKLFSSAISRRSLFV